MACRDDREGREDALYAVADTLLRQRRSCKPMCSLGGEVDDTVGPWDIQCDCRQTHHSRSSSTLSRFEPVRQCAPRVQVYLRVSLITKALFLYCKCKDFGRPGRCFSPASMPPLLDKFPSSPATNRVSVQSPQRLGSCRCLSLRHHVPLSIPIPTRPLTNRSTRRPRSIIGRPFHLPNSNLHKCVRVPTVFSRLHTSPSPSPLFQSSGHSRLPCRSCSTPNRDPLPPKNQLGLRRPRIH